MSQTDAARGANVHYEHLPTYRAVRHLIDHLREAAKVTGYKLPAEPKIEELMDDKGVYGHNLHLPAPPKGFTPFQRGKIEAYSKALTYWGGFLANFDDEVTSIVVTFSNPREEEDALEVDEDDDRPNVRDKMRPKPYRAARAAGISLVEQGFKVREPVPVALLTLTDRFNGYGMTVRYPIDRDQDKLGIIEVYDRVVPMLADLFARDMNLKSDAVKDGEFNVLFFTQDHRYVSSLYEAVASFRMVVPRMPRAAGIDFSFLTSGSYKACRALMHRYRKDFQLLKRPQPAMQGGGFTAVFHYKRGAAGKTVDEAYMLALSRMAKKLMKRYNVRAAISHQADIRCIIVTFYSERDSWSDAGSAS